MIHTEQIVQRSGTGIKLLAPGTAAVGVSVENLMASSLNFYFMDEMSFMQKMSEATASSCGYLSAHDGVGKSIRDISQGETAKEVLANDRNVVITQTSHIITETFTRRDEIELTAISIKFPWFQDNNVLGILGCSILLGYENAPDLPNALQLLMQTGLLASDSAPIFQGLKIGDVYFDQRDKEIMFLLVRGKTAKQIARVMKLSHRTIEHRLEAIKRKLGVFSKSELIERVINYLM